MMSTERRLIDEKLQWIAGEGWTLQQTWISDAPLQTQPNAWLDKATKHLTERLNSEANLTTRLHDDVNATSVTDQYIDALIRDSPPKKTTKTVGDDNKT